MASVENAIASMVKNIEEKTGKSIATWIKVAKSSGLSRHGEVVTWLKANYELSHGYANFLAKEAQKTEPATPESLVDAQYSGAKAVLRPIYAKLIAAVEAFGTDVEIAPKKQTSACVEGSNLR